jgi:hypothetical protein
MLPVVDLDDLEFQYEDSICNVTAMSHGTEASHVPALAIPLSAISLAVNSVM